MNFTNLILLSSILGPPHNDDLQEFFLECTFNSNLIAADHQDTWDIFEDLTGRPSSICFTGSPTALILRFKYQTSRQMAIVSTLI